MKLVDNRILVPERIGRASYFLHLRASLLDVQVQMVVREYRLP
jgi:hypothetical protein